MTERQYKIPGKTLFVWEINNGAIQMALDLPQVTSMSIEDAVHEIIAKLQNAGIETVILHSTHFQRWKHYELNTRLAKMLPDVGINVYVCAAVYKEDDPVHLGRLAANLVNEFDLEGVIFDAEQSWDDAPASDTRTVKMLQACRERANRGSLIGWCWWARYQDPIKSSTWHPKSVLWAAMAPQYGNADFGIPMAYNRLPYASSYTQLFEQTWQQWRDITDKPIVMGARAYNGEGDTVDYEEMKEIESISWLLGASGIAWWSMYHAVSIDEIWTAIMEGKDFYKSEEPEEPPEEEVSLEEMMDHIYNWCKGRMVEKTMDQMVEAIYHWCVDRD